MATKAQLRAETKRINARLAEIEASWCKRGVLDAEYDERHRLLARRSEIDKIVRPAASPVDSLVR